MEGSITLTDGSPVIDTDVYKILTFEFNLAAEGGDDFK